MSSSTAAPIRKSTRHCRLSQRAKEAIDSLPRSLLHSSSSSSSSEPSSTSSSTSKKEYNINTPSTSSFSLVTDNTETISIKNDDSPIIIIDDSLRNSKRTRKPSWKAEEMEKQQQKINILSPNKKKQLKRSSMSDDEDENNDIEEENDKISSSSPISKIRKIDPSSSTHSLKTEMMLQRQKRLFQLELLKAQQNLNNDDSSSSSSSSAAESSDEDNEDINTIVESINDKIPVEAQSPLSSISIAKKDDYDFIDDFALQDNDNDRFTKELHTNSPFSSTSSVSLKHISTDDEEEEDFEKYDYFDGAELFEKTAFSSEDEIEDVDFYQEKLSNINDFHHSFNEPIIPHLQQDNLSIISNNIANIAATNISHDITNLPMEIDSSIINLYDIKEINLENISANNFVITDAEMSQLIDNGNSLYSDITNIIKATLNNDLNSNSKKPELEIDTTNIEKEIAKVVEIEVNNNNNINNNKNENDQVQDQNKNDNVDFVINDLETPLKNIVAQATSVSFNSVASTNNASPSINLAEKIKNLKDEEKKFGTHSSEQRWPLSPTDNSSSFNLLDTLLIKKKSSMKFQNLNNFENTYPITNNNNETSIDDFLNLTQASNEEDKIEKDNIESDSDAIESPSFASMETVELSGSPNNSPKIGNVSSTFNDSQNQDKSLPFGRIPLDYRHQKQANLALIFNHENKSNLKNKSKNFKNSTKKALNKRAILSGRVYKEMVNTGASFGISEFLI
ncbi:hypothetical protein B5S31_g347 [[Candida] boidinii]|nr:hypothetical protein B5S31_g347 [[Candida] boidinii]